MTNNYILGECRTLWGECEQAASILAVKERKRYQKFLSISEVTILVWKYMFGTNVLCSWVWHRLSN